MSKFLGQVRLQHKEELSYQCRLASLHSSLEMYLGSVFRNGLQMFVPCRAGFSLVITDFSSSELRASLPCRLMVVGPASSSGSLILSDRSLVRPTSG